MSTSAVAGPSEARSDQRILLVEDEFLIRMLLEDMLEELGYAVAGVAGRLDEATELAKSGAFELAILDVNLDGEDVFPVADILASRGVPFVFVTGYGGRGVPEPYCSRPTLQKPFQIDDLRKTLRGFFTGRTS
jgi:CheY-like chemotaxis protein